MTSPFWNYAFLGWVFVFPPAIAAGGLVMAGRWWWRKWREAGAVIADAQHAADELPVPYWPAEPVDLLAAAVQCTWCRPKPNGRCTCSGKCGHIRCVAPRSLFTAADLEILEGKRLP